MRPFTARKTFSKIVFCFVLVSSLSAATKAEELNPVFLSYTVSLVGSVIGNATVGQLETTLTQEDNRYSVFTTTKTQGLAGIIIGDSQQSCEFTVKEGRAISENSSGGIKNPDEYQANFDWQQRKINFNSGESLDIPKGHMMDICTMPFAAALLKDDGLASDATYVFDGNKKRILGYKLRSSSNERIETPIGSLETIKVVLERELKPDRTFSLWLSPNHNHVPIKMEDFRSSRTITFLVNNIEES